MRPKVFPMFGMGSMTLSPYGVQSPPIYAPPAPISDAADGTLSPPLIAIPAAASSPIRTVIDPAVIMKMATTPSGSPEMPTTITNPPAVVAVDNGLSTKTLLIGAGAALAAWWLFGRG